MSGGEKVVSYTLPPLPPSRPSTRVSRTLRGLPNGPFRGRQHPTPSVGLLVQGGGGQAGQGLVAVSATSRFPVWHPESQPPFSLFSRGIALHDPASAPILCPPTISKHRGELIDRLRGMYREAQRQQGETHLSLWAAAEEGDPVSTGLIPASVLPRTLARTGVVVDGGVCGEVMELLLFGSGEVLCEREIAQGSLQYTPIIPQFLDDGQGVFVDWLLLCDLLCPPQVGEGEEEREGLEDGEVAALVASQMRHRLRLRIAHWKRKESMATFTPTPPPPPSALVGGGKGEGEEVALIPPTTLSNMDDAHLPSPLLASVTLQEISALVSRVGATHPAGEVSTSAFPGHSVLGAAMAHSRVGGMGEWGASKAVLLPLLSLGDALEDEAACLIATRDLACFSRRRGLLGGKGVGLELASPQAAQVRVNVREFSLSLVSPASHPQLPTPIPPTSSSPGAGAGAAGAPPFSSSLNPGDLAPPFSPLDAAFTLSLSRYGGFDEEEVALSSALRSCPHFEGHMDVVAPFLLALSGGVKGGVSASTITSPFSRTLIRETLENALGITIPLSTTALYKVALRCPPPEGAVGAPLPLPPPGYPGDEESPPPYIHLPLFIRTYLDLSPSEFTAHAKTLENAARVEQTLDSTLRREGVRGRGEDEEEEGGVRVPWGARVEKAISTALDLSHTAQALASVSVTIPPRAAFSRHIMGAMFSLGCPLSHSNALLVARRYALSIGGCTPGLGFLIHADCVADLLKGRGRWGGGGEGGMDSGRGMVPSGGGPSSASAPSSGSSGRDAGSGMIDPHAASFISSLAPPGASIRIITTPSKGKAGAVVHGGEEVGAGVMAGVAASAVMPPPFTTPHHPFLPTPTKTKSRANASTPPPQWSFPYPSSSSSSLTSTVTQPLSTRTDAMVPAAYPPTPPLPAPPKNPSNATPVAALSIKGIPSASLESRLKEFQATGRWSCTVCYYESNPPFSSSCAMCTKPNALLEMVSGEEEDSSSSSSLRTALGPLKAKASGGITGKGIALKATLKANVCEVCAWDNKKPYTLCFMCASPSIEEEARGKAVSPLLNPPSPMKQQQALSVVAPLPPPSPSSSFSSSPTPPTATVSHLLQPAVTLFTDPWRTRHTNTTILHESSLKPVTPAVLAELGLGRGGGGGYPHPQASSHSGSSSSSTTTTVPPLPAAVSEGPFKPKGFASNDLEDSISTGLMLSGAEDTYAFNISPAGKGAIARQWALGGKSSLPSLFSTSGF